MTRSTHTVKYAQANFKKYQILAIIFALLTVVASLLAAMSGIRVRTLQKSKAEAIASSSEDQKQLAETATNAIESLKKQLATSQAQLAAEKQNVKNLIGKIGELERQITATEAKLHTQQQKALADPPPPPIQIEGLPKEDQEPVAPPPLDTPEPTPAKGTETGNTPTSLDTSEPAPSEGGETGNAPAETMGE